MAKAAAALIDLDGWARRIVLCPPEWELARLELAARDAEADALVFDGDGRLPPIPLELAAPCRLPLQNLEAPRTACCETEWILPTSGTSGPPKLVVHTLCGLMGAIAGAPLQHWATFYDIRRYGGLQIFLRAMQRPRLAQPCWGRGKRRFPTDALRRCRNYPHFRHPVTLAKGPDEQRGGPDRSRPCQTVRRNCR